jgi:aspartyl/asparaginyl beta-hydroxylase (cupin superfamily)
METKVLFKYFIFSLIITLILVIILSRTKDEFFYDVKEINPELEKIDIIKHKIYKEMLNVYNKKSWEDWPEKNLYNTGNWKIFPFYAFDIWIKENCEACPETYKFLKSIKGLKSALLSKLSPKMKLNPHKGWGRHSNYVIRCHYGLLVPEGCYISVSNRNKPPLFKSFTSGESFGFFKKEKIKSKASGESKGFFKSMVYDEYDRKEEIRFHKQFKWLCFDDSKTHYAENTSDSDRIVLLLDIERPLNISVGTSIEGDTEELTAIINYYKSRNIKI